MPTQPLVVRAHHLVCLVHFAARGGTHPTLPLLLRAVRENPGRLLRVVVGPDDICQPCPHWNGATCTRLEGMEAKNRGKDARFLQALGLADGEELAAREVFARVAQRLTPAALAAICADCVPAECAASIAASCPGFVDAPGAAGG
jgi:hypothetical protein